MNKKPSESKKKPKTIATANKKKPKTSIFSNSIKLLVDLEKEPSIWDSVREAWITDFEKNHGEQLDRSKL